MFQTFFLLLYAFTFIFDRDKHFTLCHILLFSLTKQKITTNIHIYMSTLFSYKLLNVSNLRHMNHSCVNFNNLLYEKKKIKNNNNVVLPTFVVVYTQYTYILIKSKTKHINKINSI